MLQIQELSVNYDKKEVLTQVSLSVGKGIHGIVGLNGAGKTTFFKAIFGLKKVAHGEIRYKGKALERKDIAFLETENYFYSYIAGREHLALFKNEQFDLEKWNHLFKLPLDEKVDGYSTGMKKKLAFLSVLKQNKPLLILDEPFNGIDLESTRIISSILEHIGQNKTILISSHVLETLTNICDTVHYLKNGSFKFQRDRSEFDALESEIFHELDQSNQQILKELFDEK